MKFQKGNELWKLADPFKNKGAKFKTPAELWEKAVQYFEWCDNNIFTSEEETETPKGLIYKQTKHKRPYTWQGFYSFIGGNDLKAYRQKNEFNKIITHIGNIMFEQKFSGASAGIFNSSIISKELGLIEKKEVKQETTKLKIKGLDKLKDD